MKALVLFDSNYGNTKMIAKTISDELGEDSKAVSVADFRAELLEGIHLLVVGSPILAWRPSEKMRAFLSGLRSGQLESIKAASFDTRIKTFMSGDAAKKIANSLKKAGAEIIVPPQMFFVKGTGGPLLEGEKEKATQWAESLKEQV